MARAYLFAVTAMNRKANVTANVRALRPVTQSQGIGISPMTNPSHLELVNVSVRMYQIHKDLIERAAALEPDRTPSDYIRETLAMQAALDLGVELPNVPDINRGRAGGLINQAAAKLGMSREEFEQLAVRHMAAQTLEANAIAPAAVQEHEGKRGHSEIRSLASQAQTQAPPARKAR